jgi:hypothetical protein
MDTYDANRASINASNQRRAQEWTFQASTAAMDITQIGNQIDAASARLDIANKEVATQTLQVQNAQQTLDFLQNKFTNQQLYDWIVGQTSATYFNAYQLAFDLAQQAEMAFHHEVGDEASPAVTYIQFGYWDGLQQGLLAGDALAFDLKRMEAAYLEQNRRELEVVRHVSLLELDPVALAQLKANGICFVSLPESLFDGDYPGHFMRRLKSVGMTIPCEVGPYTNVNCTLTVVRHSTRWSSDLSVPYARQANDSRFFDNLSSSQSIVTSSGQSDSGLFEANLRDDRYLPFEGAGSISLWKIELPAATNAFDTTSVTDVIMHVRYTARDGGDALKQAAGAAATPTVTQPASIGPLPPLRRLFSARQDFSDAYYRFMHPDPPTKGQSMTIDFSDFRFPFHDPALNVYTTAIRVFIVPAPGAPGGSLKASLLDPTSTQYGPIAFGVDGSTNPLPSSWPTVVFAAPFEVGSAKNGDGWTLQFAASDISTGWQAPSAPSGSPVRIDPTKVADLGILCEYVVKAPS